MLKISTTSGAMLMLLLFWPASASAQDMNVPGVMTIEKVLRHVYEDSPVLESSRYGLKATHELHPQARAGYHPTINAEADVMRAHIDTNGAGGADGTTSKTASISAEQPLYRGGRTVSEIESAQQRIKAGYRRMLQTEQNVFLNAVEAYTNVLRDRAVLRAQEQNRASLQEEENSLQARFEAGDVTSTDVRRASSRAAQASALVESARGALKSSEATFEEIVGMPPASVMAEPSPAFRWPSSLPAMLEQARAQNPALFAAKFDHMAARGDVGSAESGLHPQVSAFASYLTERDPQPGLVDESDTGTVGLRVRMNLYEGGRTVSRIREAKNIANQRMIQIIAAERAVKSDLVANWNRLQTAQAEVNARTLAVEAAAFARTGIREEVRLGERTNVETLDAERDLLEAQVSLARARQDLTLVSYRLAAILGILLPEHMGMADIAYDPGPHYRAVSGRIFSADEN